MKTTIETAAKMHQDRMVRAINEFPKYRSLTNGSLMNSESGEIYHQVGNSGCTCPDYCGRVAKMRETMTAEGVATACCCKHYGIRRLLTGKSVKIGTSVFTAKKK